jgi:hypothetical protein
MTSLKLKAKRKKQEGQAPVKGEKAETATVRMNEDVKA